MNKDEIRLMASTCANYYSCGSCPYNPEDISRFIGDRWKGGCPNYDRKLVYAIGKGYGDVSEYKAEIERLKADYAKLQTNAEILARGVRDLNHENYELTEKIKQAQIDVLNKLRRRAWQGYQIGMYIVSTQEIDELIKEVQNAEDKG